MKQHNHVERNNNLQARRGQESIKQEARRHTAQLNTCRVGFAKASLPNRVVDFVGRTSVDSFSVPENSTSDVLLLEQQLGDGAISIRILPNESLY